MRENIAEIANLKPDFMGFIFWPNSARFYSGVVPALTDGIASVGVVVDLNHEDLIALSWEKQLDYLQLHGTESASFCARLKDLLAKENNYRYSFYKPKIIKAFNISDDFQFEALEDYVPHCDYFLFDAKGKLPGGNSIGFNWNLIKNYHLDHPYFLSGGIGPDDLDSIENFIESPMGKNCFAIDINSRFELEPGLKDQKAVASFIAGMRKID